MSFFAALGGDPDSRSVPGCGNGEGFTHQAGRSNSHTSPSPVPMVIEVA